MTPLHFFVAGGPARAEVAVPLRRQSPAPCSTDLDRQSRGRLCCVAAAPRSQAFLLVGTLFLLPVIVGYTAWSYWVFRGKVRAGGGYH
jgi:hypothetical protein